MLGYAYEPMWLSSSLNTPNATGGGTFGYNQSLEISSQLSFVK